MAPHKRPNVYTYRVDKRDYESVFAQTVNVSSSSGRALDPKNPSPMKGRTPWTDKREWEPDDNKAFALDSDEKLYKIELRGEPFDFDAPDVWSSHEPPSNNKKRKRSKRSRRPGTWWKERYRQEYLDELIRGDGRGDYRFSECMDCKARDGKIGTGVVRCDECFHGDLMCQECCVRCHCLNPLHKVECWSRGSFEKTSLQFLGLVIRLNHISSRCPNPQKSHQKLQILDINGIHNVTVEFCDCERKVKPYIQLLQRQIYPATQSVIKTCATFRLLDHLHLLSLVGKGGTYDFYKFLEKTTCNTGLDIPPPRYRILQRMLIQWRHLKMLKRGGWGQVDNGIATMTEGELAVLCLSCPRPDINLDSGWEKVPLYKQFLYSLMVCVDFNFRLKGQLVSSWTRDPGLGDGWSYFVPRKPYEEYIKKHVSEDNVSTCSGFVALAQQNPRSSKGLRYTGVGATVCARSEMVLANGVANLEKGERYSNSDFMVSYALKAYLPFLLMLIIAYDIACQWMINLNRRMEDDWNENLRIPAAITTVPVIPKFHHPAHQDEDHNKYNCNFVQGLGHSDCECCERLWSVTNAAAPSTKPMGPGSRLVVLNDHFRYYNWGKYVGMGATLARRYVQAVKARNQQQEAHRGLTESLPEELRENWERRCHEWEEKPWNEKGESPFSSKQEFMSLHMVEEELEAYERDRVKKGGAVYHSTSAGVFLVLRMELEESQRKIKALTKANHMPSATLSKTIAEQHTKLGTHPTNLHPGLLRVITALGEDLGDGLNEDQNAEEIQIWMPSAIPSGRREGVCVEGLVETEVKLRTAQCHDALDSIRHTLRLESHMLLFKFQNISGQRDGVKSRTVINGVHERAKVFAQGELQVLRDVNVRSYTDPERGPGRRGTREDEVDEDEPPVPADDGDEIDLVSEDRIDLEDDNDENDELLLEVWARSRAQSCRAQEEVELLREEMQRTLRFLMWKGKWWRERAKGRPEAGGAQQEGIRAYAYAQERIQLRLESKFRLMWSQPLQDMERETRVADEEEGRQVELEGDGDDEDVLNDEEGDEEEEGGKESNDDSDGNVTEDEE
ncbi:hypothetical protein V5O48_011577 [Marasmius crinis-equi]|uniref:CxC2-like cysteine cluster KDZ transposase-associated domain-containing protein n=1 Tax=Marasmius crinis-equi TaxID=585013 RepID=A0ABR3F5B2_9AGAR